MKHLFNYVSSIIFSLLIVGVYTFLGFVFLATPTFAEEPIVEPAPGVTNSAEYQTYLNENYGTVATNLGNVDVANYIKVIENNDQFKSYDLAVVIDYDVIAKSINVGEVLGNINYTEEQKTEFKDSFKNYQSQISKLTEATFPGKKIRGGFTASGYRYKNLKKGYYERSWYGWKNYKYTSNSGLSFYKDTAVDKLNWFDFGDNTGAPLDNI